MLFISEIYIEGLKMNELTLNIALIQTDLVWENPKQNRLKLTSKIEGLAHKVDVLVLPELFTSGFTMNPQLVAETVQGETVNWLKALSKKCDCAITGSIVIKDGGLFRNRMLFVQPNGEITHYDKRHSFTLAGEDKVYTSGTKKVIVDYKGFKLCLQICYDLRFPVFARNTENYDALIYVANWPNKRVEAWRTLLKARAIENMSYVIGVNRVGVDANGFEYSGHSQAHDMLGKTLINTIPNSEQAEVVTLDKNSIETLRTKLGFFNDKDNFRLVD